jgi:signal transduction histidine kinase
MDLALLFETMLGLTSLSALWTGLWLWWHARFQPVLKPLAGFCAMMAVWCGGHLALQHDLLLPGKALILANPLMPAFFLQFALAYVTTQPRQPQLRWIEWLRQYQSWFLLASVLVVLLSWSQPSARVQALYGMPVFFLFDGFGWFNLAYTVLLGMLAHWVLWRGRHAYHGNKHHSVVAISMTAGLGLLLATSFVFPSLGLNWYPYPMLVLPLYLVLLVYSVVRYQMLAVNAFASRALVYLVMGLLLLLLMALMSSLFGQFGMPALAAVPGWQLWLYSSLLLLLAAAAYRPASRLAERLIFPGVQLSEAMVSRWQQQLSLAADWQQLAEQSALLIRQPLKQPVQICLLQGAELLAQSAEVSALKLMVIATDSDDQSGKHWQFSIPGEQGLTPTLKLTAEVFGSLLVSSCGRLQSALALAEAQKQQLAQQHLVELGALAASMAHELRNPLNIISMASAAVDAELRGHIQTQLKRADRLIADMLVYAGRLQLQPTLFPLQPLVKSLLLQAPAGVRTELAMPADLQLYADPYRMQQVLQNLFDNAFAFLRNQPGACLRVEASTADAEVQIRVLNNGPALDPALLGGQLFRPFVSKRAGGSGLGLAIVARIILAHQGRIQHDPDPDWPVCFTLYLPVVSGEIR